MTRRSSRTRVAISLTAVLFASVALVGCSGYRGNPTPGVSTLGVSNQRNWNRAATTWDTNLRAFVDDFAGTLWLMDRPSRLHKRPSPY